MNEQLTEMSKEVIQESLLLINTSVPANDQRWSELLVKITGQPSAQQLLEPITVGEFTQKDVLLAHMVMWPAFISVFMNAKPEEFPKETFIYAMECYERAMAHGGWILSLTDVRLSILTKHFIELKDNFDKNSTWSDQLVIDDLTLNDLLSGGNFMWSTMNRLGSTVIDLHNEERQAHTSMVYVMGTGLTMTKNVTVPICEFDNIHDKEIKTCFGHVLHMIAVRFNQIKNMADSIKLINPIAQKIYVDSWKNIVMEIVKDAIGAREAYRSLGFARNVADGLGNIIPLMDPDKLAENFQVMLENAEKITMPQANVTRH